MAQTRPAAERSSATDPVSVAQARARAHWRVARAILGINGALFGALILLIAYNKPLLGRLVAPGLSLAIVFGTIVTVAAWLLTLVYARWANRSDHGAGHS